MVHSRRQTPDLFRKLTIIVVAAAALFLVFLAVRHDCWEDEGFTVRRIGSPWERLYNPFAPGLDWHADPFDRRFTIDYNPPLYFALLRVILGANPAIVMVRAASIAAFFIGLFGLMWWARRAVGLRTRPFLLLLYVLSPALIFYGHEGRPYMLPISVAMLGMGLIWSQAARPWRLFFICLVMSLAGSLMNYHFAWLVIALAGALCVIAVKPRRPFSRTGALASLAGLIIGSACALAAVAPQWKNLSMAATVKTDPADFETIVRMMVLPVAGPFNTTMPKLRPIAIALWIATCLPMLALVLYGLARLPRSRRAHVGWISLMLWLGPLALMLIAHAAIHAPLSIRYATFSLPGWLMFATWLAREISDDDSGWHRRPSAALAILFMISLVMNVFMLVHPTRQVWKPAIRDFTQNVRPGDLYTFDPDEIKYAFAVNAGTPPPAKYFALTNKMPAASGAIWLLAARNPSPQTMSVFEKNGYALARRIDGDVTLWIAEKKK